MPNFPTKAIPYSRDHNPKQEEAWDQSRWDQAKSLISKPHLNLPISEHLTITLVDWRRLTSEPACTAKRAAFVKNWTNPTDGSALSSPARFLNMPSKFISLYYTSKKLRLYRETTLSWIDERQGTWATQLLGRKRISSYPWEKLVLNLLTALGNVRIWSSGD